MQIVGVRFKDGGKIYDFQANGLELKANDAVIVSTARGMEYGWVTGDARTVTEEEYAAYKPVLRLATEADNRRLRDLRARKAYVLKLAQEKITAKKMEMALVDVEIGFEDNKVLIYFTADGRVDFRELVKELAQALRTRIELRQIGVRDEARMMGGLGPCGRECCCAAFLPDFQPVSIKMAKDQGLSLNPTKISGLCGRLMCCLKYEQSSYEALKKRMPRTGKEVSTPDGKGTVVELQILAQRVKVKRPLPEGGWEFAEYPLEEIHWQREAESAPKAENKNNR
nr:stage 0 sporulation family protein [bacterium]